MRLVLYKFDTICLSFFNVENIGRGNIFIIFVVSNIYILKYTI